MSDKQIDATVELAITHTSGPEIADADHVRRWLCDDANLFNGEYGGFTFAVCSVHADPEDCLHCAAEVSGYLARVMTVLQSDDPT